MIYVYKNGQRSGPHEDHIVLDDLRYGRLSPDDMAIRPGGPAWLPLKAIFPDLVRRPIRAPAPAAQPKSAGADPLAQFGPIADALAGVAQKVSFGFGFLVLAAAFGISTFYFLSLWAAPSAGPAADLRNLPLRDLALSAVIWTFVGAFMAFVAFLFRFKRNAIAPNSLRIVLRLGFIAVALIGIGQVNYVMYAFLTYLMSEVTDGTKSNELLDILFSSSAVGAWSLAAFHFPVGLGLTLVGLSGNLMANRNRSRGKITA